MNTCTSITTLIDVWIHITYIAFDIYLDNRGSDNVKF